MERKNIVLLHGWGAMAVKLELLANELKNNGWKVLNLDMPGFGAEPPKTAWGLSEYADWVEQQVKGDYVVFGHSFGGRVAIKLAARQAKNLEGIVLCAPGGFNQENRLKIILFERLAKAGKKIINSDGARKWLYKLAGAHDYERANGVMREVFKKVIGEDLISQLDKVNLPTLVLWGSRDGMVSVRGGEIITKGVKGAKLEIFEGETHKLPYNQPKWVAERIQEWMR